jgi:hypothetical protein
MHKTSIMSLFYSVCLTCMESLYHNPVRTPYIPSRAPTSFPSIYAPVPCHCYLPPKFLYRNVNVPPVPYHFRTHIPHYPSILSRPEPHNRNPLSVTTLQDKTPCKRAQVRPANFLHRRGYDYLHAFCANFLKRWLADPCEV